MVVQYLTNDGSRTIQGSGAPAGFLRWDEGSSPTTPPANHWILYFKSTGLFYKDDAGAETGPLGTGGGAGDDLGNHTATQDLDMATFDIDRVNSLWSGAGTGSNIDFGASNVLISIGGTAKLNVATNVELTTDLSMGDQDIVSTDKIWAGAGTGNFIQMREVANTALVFSVASATEIMQWRINTLTEMSLDATNFNLHGVDLHMQGNDILSVDRIFSGAGSGNAIDMDIAGIAILTTGTTNDIFFGNNLATDFTIHDSGYFNFSRAVSGGGAIAGDLWRATGGNNELVYTDNVGNEQLSPT